ncbi:unnamed protein product, partial [Discosporangium mesarthrocarpum]
MADPLNATAIREDGEEGLVKEVDRQPLHKAVVHKIEEKPLYYCPRRTSALRYCKYRWRCQDKRLALCTEAHNDLVPHAEGSRRLVKKNSFKATKCSKLRQEGDLSPCHVPR